MIVSGGTAGALIVELHVNGDAVLLALSDKLTVNENGPDVEGVPVLDKVTGDPLVALSPSHEGADRLQE